MTEDAQDRMELLAQALPFLKRYDDQIVVVKYGGHAMGEEETALRFGRDIALLEQVGVNPVVVHGGGPQINTMLKRLNVQSTFVDGLRVTDAAMVDVVEMVLAGSVNKQVAAAITRAGAIAVGISGKDGGLIRARKLARVVRDPGSNIERVLDLGFVGEPEHVDARVLKLLIGADIVPVVAPAGVGEDGQTYNINADTVAGAIAGALERAGVSPSEVELVSFGQVIQAGQGQIPSRQAQIKGGIPKEVPSETVNKVCASGMRAVGLIDLAIRAGDVEVGVGGGMESMSNAPYLLPGARFGYRMGDVKTVDAMTHDGLTNPFTHLQMIN
jgi:acetylglutamate kinase